MHLEDEQIQRILHDQLDGATSGALSSHIEACEECARRVQHARREELWILELLSQVDRPAPQVDVAALVARSRRGIPAWGRWAAAVLLVLGAGGVAYAAPGSPLPGWVTRVAAWIAGSSEEPTAPSPPPEPPKGVTAGIAVPPGARFTILFRAPQSSGKVAVSVTDGQDIVVRALSGAVTFTTDVDRLSVENEGAAADYEIELPLRAPWVDIRVGARRLMLKDGHRLEAEAAADDRGRYVVPVGP